MISGQQLPKPKDSILGDRGEVCRKFYMQFVSSYSVRFQEGMKREVKEGKSPVGLSGLHHVDDMV